MSENRIGIYLDLFGGDKAQSDLKAVARGMNELGPASQAGARMATQQLGSMQMSAAQTANALRGVPAQFTDIVVSLQSGQAPLTVLLQQGGQLKDMFGGMGAAARALGGYVLGLITPLSLLAGGVVALGAAYYQGSKEQDAFNRSIIMSGNLAGVTAGKLQDMARSLSGQGYSQSGAAEALAKLVETGKVGSEHLEKFAAVAMDLEKRAGIPIANTVENMAALGKEPVQASMRLNEQYGYLTTATLAQIKASEEEGRAAEAASRAQDAWASAMAGRTKELTSNLGYIERGWDAVKRAVSAAWNTMLGIGRTATPEERLGALGDEIANIERSLSTGKGFGETGGGAATGRGRTLISDKERAELQRRLASLRSDQAAAKAEVDKASEAAKKAAQSQANQNAGNAALVDIDKTYDRFKSKADQSADAIKKFRAEIASAQKAFDDPATDAATRADLGSRLDPKKIAATEAAIRKQYADKGGGGNAVQRADRRLDLSELQNAMRQEQAMIGQQQQQLEISRAAGLVSLEDYYSQKRVLIEKNSTVEESAIKQQIERLESEKTKGADALNLQKQLTDLRGKLAVRQIQTQNELADADQKSAKALQQHSAAMAQLTTNTAAYIQQLQARADLQVASVGMGQQRSQYESGLLSIREKYSQQIRDLEDQRGTASNWTKENEDYFQKRVRLLKLQQQEEVGIYEETFDRINAAQGIWQNGALAAMADYLTSSRNVAQQTADAFSKGFQGMEDALVTFVTTGKLSFTDLANSIVADITRIIIKQQISNAMGVGGSGGGGLMNLIGAGIGMLGGSSAVASVASSLPGDSLDNFIALKGLSGGRAKGGLVDKGSLYEVNEKGPELLTVGGRDFLMMGQQSGRVTPNDQLGRGGDSSTVIHINVTAPQGGGSRETALQFGRTVGRQIQVAQARNG